MRGKELM